MARRWFGPKSGSGRGLSAAAGGLSPASWQGWILVLLLIAVIVGVGAFPDIGATTAWIVSGAAVALFLVVAALTYGPDSD